MAVGLGVPSPAAPLLSSWVNDPVKSGIWRDQRIGWDRYHIEGHGGVLKKSVILRLPDGACKGVILTWFEYDLLTLLSARHLDRILDRYRIVFFGSWSPPCYQALWSIPPGYRKEVLAGLSHPDDGERINSLGFNVATVPLYMSHWQAPDDFHPNRWIDRDVDIVMVANWAKFKRHWVMFDALRKMRRPDLRVVIIGQPESRRNVATVLSEAEAFGVSSQIEFYDRLSAEQVWRWLERSRVSLIFSRREGSCVVVAESLMAGTPVGLLTGAGIGSRVFINGKTGRLLNESNLSEELSDFLRDAENFSPRRWAEEEIQASLSRETLQSALDETEPDSGPIFSFRCRATLIVDSSSKADRMKEELLQFEGDHDLTFVLHAASLRQEAEMSAD